VNILFYNPAPAQKRFVPYEAIKGSAFFRRPNYDAMRLKYLSCGNSYHYYDERIEAEPEFNPDIVVINVPLNLARYIQNTARKRWPDSTIISYGFFATLVPDECKKFSDVVVTGDIANIWNDVLSDAQHDRLAPHYQSDENNQFHVDRTLETRYGFTPLLSQLRTSFGCTCDDEDKNFCYENIIYPDYKQWDVKEVTEEVARIKRKIVFLRDDDFLHDLDYACSILERCWRYKKMWVFQTNRRLFQVPSLARFLRDNGVRIIWFKEDWLGQDLVNLIDDPDFLAEKKRQVNLIHKYRITFGCKLRLGYEGENPEFYQKLSKFLMKTKVDLVKITVQTPIPHTPLYKKYMKKKKIAKDLTLYDQWMPVVNVSRTSPQTLYARMEWLRDRFYSWDSILLRNILVSPQLGVYNTIFFYLIPNLSFRNNFLEKVGYPP
jgi:radical SAM superfamily enzyme YgiQ (UPF0313 family)